MKIISCGNAFRFDANINHQIYCDFYQIPYEFYLDKAKQPPNYIKLDAIIDSLQTYNEVLYIDDDAFFADKHWNCKQYFANLNGNFIVTQGPKVKSTRTLFNTGVMFFRKSNAVLDMLLKVPYVTRKEMINNWKKEYGYLGDGYDNVRMIYLSQTTPLKKECNIIDYPGFNCKELNYKKNRPIVHFVSRGKKGKMSRFKRKFNIDLYNI